jgi:hypothetical protein
MDENTRFTAMNNPTGVACFGTSVAQISPDQPDSARFGHGLTVLWYKCSPYG